MLERILLGDSAFIGADPLIQDIGRESLAQLDPEEMVKVMKASFNSGAEGFVFYTHPANRVALKLLRSQESTISFGLYPLFPYAREYVKDATVMGPAGMLIERVKRLALAGKVKAVFEAGLAALTTDPHKMMAMTLETEIDEFIDAAPSHAELRGIFLHDVIVDLSVALDLKDMIQTHLTTVADKYRVKPGLATKNFSRLVSFLERNDFPTRELMILTPFNPLGFQMNPSRQSCEETLAGRPYLDVIAMGLLSAGILDLETALGYIKRVQNLRSVVVGSTRPEQAQSTFNSLARLKNVASTVIS